MLISTIIPCYNCEEYIEETINSILNQTHTDIEIICVDNNSKDNTLPLLRKLEKENSIIKVYSEPKSGANYARNLGLKHASGEFLQYLDSDDVIEPDKFEKQSAFLKEKELDVVVSDRNILDSKLDKILESHTYSEVIENKLETAISKIIITGNPLYRTEVVRKLGGYLEHLITAQDWEFHIRLFLSKAEVGYLPGYFLKCRRLATSLSSNYIEVSDSACSVIELYKKEFLKKEVYLNNNIMQKFISTYLISYLNSKDEIKEEYKSELLFWSDKSDSKNFKFGKLGLINRLFGMRTFLFIKNLTH